MSTLTASAPLRGPSVPSPRQRALFALATLLCIVIALVSYRYVFSNIDILPLIPHNRFYHPFLFIHVSAAATALLIMSLQLVPRIRNRWPVVHRWVGRTYVATCVVGAIAGFMLAIGTAGGPRVGVGFVLLSLAWFTTTVLGWRAARQRRFADHREWMIRSYSLTFAAVTLRLYIPIALVLGLPFIPSYIAIAYLCWIPNLIIAELYLRLSRRPIQRVSAAPE